MPELPEVEIVIIGLKQLIIGKNIKKVTSDFAKSFPNDKFAVSKFMIGSDIVSIRRKGKVILIDLSTGYSLMTHLRMTGQLVYVGLKNKRFGAGHPNGSLTAKLPDKSTRVDITFSDNAQLYFNDQRKFGRMNLLPTELVKYDSFIAKLGPEPLNNSFTPEVFSEQLRSKSGSTIKAALLDQSVLAGIGNIYADESLWLAKIHPSIKAGKLSRSRITALHGAIVKILKASIDAGGSTSKNYVNAKGEKGSYLTAANVYRREGKPCRRCKTLIEKTRVAGRGTHTCSTCQQIKNK